MMQSSAQPIPHSPLTGDLYEVFAVRYAQMPERRRADNFIGGDPHDGPMPMDFFVWVIRNDERVILVDTGFNEATARARKREFLGCPVAALEGLSIQPDHIDDVIITHLHYDHAGNLDKVPAARFHLQDDEMRFATGRSMCHAPLRHAYAVEDVVSMVRHVYAQRVVFHDGDADIAPGIRLLKIGGHTEGLQAVQVNTARGWVVLASDASHYYANLFEERPFPIVASVPDMLAGYDKLRAHATSDAHIVPGHDPLVRERYPQVPGLTEIFALHEEPLMIASGSRDI